MKRRAVQAVLYPFLTIKQLTGFWVTYAHIFKLINMGSLYWYIYKVTLKMSKDIKKRELLKIGLCITFNPIFTHIFKVYDINKDFKKFAEIGYRGIEISIRDTADINWDNFNAVLQKNFIELVTIATGLVRKIDNISLMDQKKEDRNSAVLRLNKMIEKISEYDSSERNILIGYVKGELSVNKTENKKRLGLLNKSLDEILELAEKKKVRILIEVINHKETNFINDIASGVEFISGFNSDYLKLLIDTYHMNIDEKDCYQAVKEAGACIGNVHISDDGRKFPGHGNMDFKPILKALNEIGYSGYLTIESNEVSGVSSANENTEESYKPLISGYNYIRELIQNMNK